MTQPISSAHQPGQDASQIRAELRQFLLQQRRAVDASLRHQWDLQIAHRLLVWCRQNAPASLGVYWPIQAEPDLRDCYQQLSDSGIVLALPLVQKKNTALRFLAWRPGDPMSVDGYGIPVPEQREHWIQPAALLIPCVGFNAQRYRLGYGGGYYDRTLEHEPRPVTVGVAYRCAEANFPAEAHDIAMDVILTDAA
ncbi:5-formyltetrahydrofolate cyclo-ligase [Undibacterium sp. SXout7W]|uniref:5-formyltetrahydrofolate cyclo-ligase n=1 Tax=Undibacterium sp. SXout7W TaxID=3413049 RepID=UPI003BF1D3FC